MTVKAGEEGNNDGAENEGNSEDQNDGSKSGDNEDQNAGGNSGGSGENSEGNENEGGEGEGEGGSGEGEGSGEEDPRDGQIATLTSKIAELEKNAQPPKKETEDPQPKERTQAEWDTLSEKTGQSKEALQYQEGQLVDGLRTLGSILMKNISGMMAPNAKSGIIEEMSKTKDFADIKQYQEGIDEHLKGVDPRHHGNKQLITNAYWIAKGKGLKKAVRNANSNSERNRKIAGPGRPASPSNNGNNSSPTKGFKMNAMEESMFKSSGENMGMNREEYIKGLPRFKRSQNK